MAYASSSQTDTRQVITKQKCTEVLYLCCGKEKGRPAWHYILARYDKIPLLKSKPIGVNIDVEEFGNRVRYRNERGQVQSSSGWGQDPPEEFHNWICEQYDNVAVDENTSLIYVADDIRLCTMQRSTPDQKLGIFTYYHRYEGFHFITLYEDFQSTLAYRAGVKNYDRLIEFNGVNIENETLEQLTEHFQSQLHLPAQMLLCNPSTYAHYKSNNKRIHSELPTVKRLKPIRDTALPDTKTVDEYFCAVKWENSDTVVVVPTSTVLKPPELICLNEIRTIEQNGWQRKGQIILKGSKSECETLQSDQSKQSPADISSSLKSLSIDSTPQSVSTESASSPLLINDESKINQRFTDVADEKHEILLPIEGYEKQPLVPLEQAVAPLVSILPDIQRKAYVTKLKCKNPANGLTPDQSASIMLYTMEWEPHEQCLYVVLNATLRNAERRMLIPWFLYLKLILTALARLPSIERTVYRGVKLDLSSEHKEGDDFFWWGFSSCTSTMNILRSDQFLGETGERTLFAIECSNGKDIQRHSYFQKEGEVLLLPAIQFVVVSNLRMRPDVHVIQLKETKPLFPFLEPVA